MQSIRCVACSLVNFTSSSACKRCGSPLASSENGEGQFQNSLEFSGPGIQPAFSPTSSLGGRYDQYGSSAYASAEAPKRKTFGVIALALVCLGAAIGIPWYVKGSKSEFADLSWKEFKADNGSFSILMPLEPERKKVDESTPEGPIHGDMYRLQTQGKTTFYVGSITFPPTPPIMPDQRLDAAFNVWTRGTGAVILSRKSINRDGYQGMEWEIRPPTSANLPNDKGVVRMYWAGPTLYLMMIGGPDSPEAAAARTKYLDSFKINRPR